MDRSTTIGYVLIFLLFIGFQPFIFLTFIGILFQVAKLFQVHSLAMKPALLLGLTCCGVCSLQQELVVCVHGPLFAVFNLAQLKLFRFAIPAFVNLLIIMSNPTNQRADGCSVFFTFLVLALFIYLWKASLVYPLAFSLSNSAFNVASFHFCQQY